SVLNLPVDVGDDVLEGRGGIPDRRILRRSHEHPGALRDDRGRESTPHAHAAEADDDEKSADSHAARSSVDRRQAVKPGSTVRYRLGREALHAITRRPTIHRSLMRVAIRRVTACSRRGLPLVSALLPVTLQAFGSASAQAPAPTFSRDIAPI